MAKEKIELTPDLNVDSLLNKIQEIYKDEDITTIDGVKIDFPENWVHLRKSNTEPIVRIYTEAKSQKEADELAQRFISELEELSK
jgi:phosphomannomutase